MQISVINAPVLWLLIAVISYLFSSPSLDENNNKEPFRQISSSKRKRTVYSLVMATVILVGLLACNAMNL
ncbi:MAG: hypothetical protein H6Q74_1349 [Firmicutes bacterium]|nr:hypothetical protein [Bacillota bacterium]